MAVDHHEPGAVEAKPGLMAHIVARFDRDSWFQCAIMGAATSTSPTNAARKALRQRAAANHWSTAFVGKNRPKITRQRLWIRV